MKKNITLLFLMSIYILTSAQSNNYNQELLDLISTKRWFEIDRYYNEHKDSIDDEFVKLLYIAETGIAFNHPAQSIDAYEQLLDKNLSNMNSPALIGRFGQALVDICINEQEFARGEVLCKKMITILQNDTTNEVTSLVQDLGTLVEQFKGWENETTTLEIIDHNPRCTGEVQLIPNKPDNGIYFNTKWNSVNLRTHFDTGANVNYISKKAIAEKIGVKLNIADTILLNNGSIKVLKGIVDSLTFGKFCIKNVPVFVNIKDIDPNDHHQVMYDSILTSNFDIVLGMPVIKKLGVIEFNFEKNTMSFPKSNLSFNKRNLYLSGSSPISGGNLYMNIKIDNGDFLTFFDTGGKAGLFINTDFYEKHKQYIWREPQATLHEGAVGGANEECHYSRYEYKCPKIEIQVQDKKVMMINDCAVAIDKENDDKLGTAEGGNLGNEIFKYCKKAVFDFNNMEFSIE